VATMATLVAFITELLANILPIGFTPISRFQEMQTPDENSANLEKPSG